jgi:insertion element IS1 protein InsB
LHFAQHTCTKEIQPTLDLVCNTCTAYEVRVERRSGCILAWHNGKRTDKDFLVLWCMLQSFPISVYHTDNWGSYLRYIPAWMHRIGKDNTWKIERKNLNFRTHIKRLSRKTICFSKNEQIHDNVIGMYIENFYYKTGTYGNN